MPIYGRSIQIKGFEVDTDRQLTPPVYFRSIWNGGLGVGK